jgi:hypothetical protein
MTDFEKHLRKEIERQANRARKAEGTPLAESESRLLRALVKTFDEYRKARHG